MQKINMDDIKTTKEKKKIYYGVDFFKLVCALLIVLMHSDCHDLTYHGYRPFIATWLIYWLPNLSVPFFFIASGFFFTKGLQRNADDQWHYLRRYLLRIFKMYVFWTIVTLPIAWKCIEAGHSDYSIPLRLVYIVRMFLFSGSLGIYWFILSLMYVAAMIYFTERKHCDWLFYTMAIGMWIVGHIYGLYYTKHAPTTRDFLYPIYFFFGSTRNFLNAGMIFMGIGHFFAKHKINISMPWLLIALLASLVLLRYQWEWFHIAISYPFAAGLLFLVASRLQMKWLAKYSLHVRKLSTAIYLGQFPFLLVFDFYLRKGTLLDFSLAVLFCVVLYILVIKFLPKKWSDIIYG